MDNQFEMWIKEGLRELSVDISFQQAEQFYRYYEMLIEWNKVMNLTAITDMDQVIAKHFIDSASLIKIYPDLGNSELKVLDLGTGAGFPGIPLKIIFPNLNITLVDSLNKRIKFLNEVIGQLFLTHISAVHGRAEDLGNDKNYRESFDLCVSRAVANLSTLSEYCLPFVCVGGYFVSYKSEKIEEELDHSKTAIKILGGQMDNVITFQLPGTDAGRSLIKIRKSKSTPNKYPRKAGTPGKEPLS